MKASGSLRRPSLDDLWLAAPILALLVWLSLGKIPGDFWWHLRIGQVIVDSRQIPTVDALTFTRAGQPYTTQAWLMQAIYYLFYGAGNLPLMVFLHRALIVAGYVLVMLACLQNPSVRPPHAALATSCAMLLGSINWALRPQSASFLCFGLLVFILERHRAHGGKIIWALPLLFAAWANLHAAFVFGFLLLGAYLLAALVRCIWAPHAPLREPLPVLISTLLSLVLLSLNPRGPAGILDYGAGLLRSSAVQSLAQEWLPLSFRELDGLIFSVVVLGFLFLVYFRKPAFPTYLILALPLLALLSLYARRVLPWFGMAAAPAFAIAFASLPSLNRGAAPARSGIPALNLFLAGLLLAGAVISLPWLQPHLPRAGSRFSFVDTRWAPSDASRVLCGLGDGVRPYANVAYGSYLTWACPSVPVFMDTRFELYPGEMWQDYMVVAFGQVGWQDVLRKYGIDTILADKKSEAALVVATQSSEGWENLYEDDYTVLLRRVEH